MAIDSKAWTRRPAVVYGLGFWNKRSMRGMLAHLPGEPRFFSSFPKAIRAAQASNASLFAWATRLTDEQRAVCQSHGIPIVNVEDGFVRSVGLGAAFTPAASLIMDSSGIYYDPSCPSDLEFMLEHETVTHDERARGKAFRQKLVELKVSKYNLGNRSPSLRQPESQTKILVPGQVSDDASIKKSRSDSLDLTSGENPNLLLLKWVREHNPEAYIVFKPHPDVTNGLREGALNDTQMLTYADVVETETDILELIDQCDCVHTISSLSGFEALLRDKQVIVHGLPFYAGWGVCEDMTPCSRRNKSLLIDELVFLAMIRYPSYVDPITFKACEAEEAVETISRLRINKAHSLKDRGMLILAKLAFRLGL